jgi:hypothetical protein
MPVRIPLSFDTPAGWGTVRPNDNFAAWAQAMAEARAGSGLGRKKRLERLQTYWTAVAAALYTPAFPYSYRAMVLIPRDGDGKVTTIAHLSRYEELLSFAYEGIVLDGAEGGDSAGEEPALVEEASCTPFETAAGVASKCVSTFARTDGRLIRVVGYYWWFPDAGATIELRTYFEDLIDADRAMPALDALAASATRMADPEGALGPQAEPATAPSV